MNLIAEGTSLDSLPQAESYLAEGDSIEVRLYLEKPLAPGELASLESELRSQGVDLASITSESTIVSIKARVALLPLVPIAAVIALLGVTVGGWQLFSSGSNFILPLLFVGGAAFLAYMVVK